MSNVRPGSSASRRENWADWTIGLAVVAATFLVYLPSLRGEFLWNDRDYVTKPALHSLAGLGRIWSDPGATEQYYPLLHSFFWLQHALWGDHPLGYRLVSLGLHAASGVLFGLFLKRLMGPGAWVAALLFALHPVHVESVAWIAEQKNTFSLFFYLTATLIYLRFDETRHLRYYFVALAFFLLSLACKTVTATLPAALLVVFWWKRGRLEWRRDGKPLVPWLVLGAGCGLFSGWIERHYGGAGAEVFDLSAWQRILVAGRAIFFYLGSLVWPFNLNFVYPRWAPDPRVWWQWLFPLGVAVTTGILWALRGRSRAPLAVFLIFAGSLFPALGFVNLYGSLYSYVWDHWQYLPDLAPCALGGAGLVLGVRHFAGRVGRFAPAAVVLLGLAVLTWNRAVLFRDDPTLLTATIARNPECWMAYSTLGAEIAATGKLNDAVGYFQKSLEINPANPQAEAVLGNALWFLGRREEALPHLERAVTLAPLNAPGRNLLGERLAEIPGRTPEAVAQFREAIRLAPDYPLPRINLARALLALPGGEEEAIEQIEMAAKLGPQDPATMDAAGRMMMRIPGKLPEAVGYLRTAVQLNPGSPEAHFDLGEALARTPGGLAESIAQFEAVLRAQPLNPAAHLRLGLLLSNLPERAPDSIAHFRAVLQTTPASIEAHYNLAVMLLRTPDGRNEAQDHLEAALRIQPGFEAARALLAQLRSGP